MVESAPGEPDALSRAVGRLDMTVDGWFDHLRGRPVADRVFYTASMLGDDGRLWLALVVARLGRPDRRRDAVLAAAWLGIESALVNGPFKMATRRERPGAADGHRHPHRLRGTSTSSFPSGHAASAALMATLLSQDSRRAPVHWAAALTIAASRIHVRAHHASDVLAGLATGVAIGAIARVVNRRLSPLPGERRRGWSGAADVTATV